MKRDMDTMVAKYKQMFKHDPENNVFGDCYRTAIACLLEVSPKDVPHFWVSKDQTSADITGKMNAWLYDTYGYTLVEVPFNTPHHSDAQNMFTHDVYKDTVYTLAGLSKNGTNHMVVCQAGEIIHDPALDDSGIVGPCDDGYYWLGFLTVAKPTSIKPTDLKGIKNGETFN